MKIVLADYFLGLSTRQISGGMRPWRLYYDSPWEAARKNPKCDAAFSGDLYLSENIKDIASTYYPLTGPYDTEDPDIAEYHVLLAKSAGIDGFMCEFTTGQENKLLPLVDAAAKYDFKLGINWISQSHIAENTWKSRSQAMQRAADVMQWLAEKVYKRCGVKVNEKYLVLIFLAHPREPREEFEPFFSPKEISGLKKVARVSGVDADFLTLPWEWLPENSRSGERASDGYFPWVWSSSGNSANEGGWTHVTTRQEYLQRLRDYYSKCHRLREQGQIGSYIGAVCPGFDDHKGQAWGEGFKRYLPRDEGLTLKQTWAEVKKSGVETALVITWNDWVESSQIEPSLELGYSELLECARESAAWKQQTLDEPLIGLPERLLDARQKSRFLSRCGAARYLNELNLSLDQAAIAISRGRTPEASELLSLTEATLQTIEQRLVRLPVHALWERGFDATGIQGVGDGAFVLSDSIRSSIHLGHFVGRLTLEYSDADDSFVDVLVDAPDAQHQSIASFRKNGTGARMKASMDLVNARFVRGLNGADIQIRSKAQADLSMLRIDGLVYRLDE